MKPNFKIIYHFSQGAELLVMDNYKSINTVETFYCKEDARHAFVSAYTVAVFRVKYKH